MTAYVGIDLGTQSVRAVVVSAEDGTVLGSGTAALTSRRDGDRHEQDPESWWTAVATACRAALTEFHRDLTRASIAGVAVDGTSGTVLLVDRTGNPRTAGIMYDDTRAREYVGHINEIGGPVWETQGYQRMQPSWALPKLCWLESESPPLRWRGARLAHQTDFINTRLAGHPVPTDTSNALKTGCDLISGVWPYDVLDAIGLPRELFPDLVSPGTPIGSVSRAAADATGLPTGVPIVAGMTDGCAAQLSSGALSPGSWNSVLGTTLVLKGVTAELIHDPGGAVYSHRGPDGEWLPGGASGAGAGVLSRDLPGRDLDALSRLAGEYEPSTALAYPLTSTRGERFPFVAPKATAFLIGTPADDTDHYAAILQGVSYLERLAFERLDMLGATVDGPLVLTGGATRSRYWCQLRADILGRSVTIVDGAGSAPGMAILAAYGVSGRPAGRTVAEVAAPMVRTAATIDPRPVGIEPFRDAYLALLAEFSQRGWLSDELHQHARDRVE